MPKPKTDIELWIEQIENARVKEKQSEYIIYIFDKNKGVRLIKKIKNKTNAICK